MTGMQENRTLNIAITVLCVATPLVVGIISAGLAGDQMKKFGELNQPPLSPPAWLFPVAWTILYILMGIVLLMIVKSEHEYKIGALAMFFSQMIMNFLWSPVFFVRREYVGALVILVLMLITTVILAAIMWRINELGTALLIPYILWMCFATYLNAGVGMLNR